MSILTINIPHIFLTVTDKQKIKVSYDVTKRKINRNDLINILQYINVTNMGIYFAKNENDWEIVKNYKIIDLIQVLKNYSDPNNENEKMIHELLNTIIIKTDTSNCINYATTETKIILNQLDLENQDKIIYSLLNFIFSNITFQDVSNPDTFRVCTNAQYYMLTVLYILILKASSDADIEEGKEGLCALSQEECIINILSSTVILVLLDYINDVAWKDYIINDTIKNIYIKLSKCPDYKKICNEIKPSIPVDNIIEYINKNNLDVYNLVPYIFIRLYKPLDKINFISENILKSCDDNLKQFLEILHKSFIDYLSKNINTVFFPKFSDWITEDIFEMFLQNKDSIMARFS